MFIFFSSIFVMVSIHSLYYFLQILPILFNALHAIMVHISAYTVLKKWYSPHRVKSVTDLILLSQQEKIFNNILQEIQQIDIK